jgi:hypothetical protein
MSEVLERAKSIGIRIAAIVALALTVSIYGLAGITHVELGEVGLSIKAVGGDRGSVEVLTPGPQWVEPFSNDVVNYDARLKQYALDDTTASTQDGQPINMDVSLEIGLVGTFVPTLHKDMGPNWFENVVYPSAITEIREATASVKSDEIYTGKGRAEVQALATRALSDKYAKSGIRISVNVRDVTFTNKAYVTLLEQKAGASQQEIIQTRQAAAAVQEAIKVANIAEGQKRGSWRSCEARGPGGRGRRAYGAARMGQAAWSEREGVRYPDGLAGYSYVHGS